MKITKNQFLLWIGSSLIVTTARHLLQYGYFPWHKSIIIFFGSWFLHFAGLGLVSALVSASVKYFFKIEKQSVDDELVTSLVFTCLVLAFVSLFILFLKYVWVPGVSDLDFE